MIFCLSPCILLIFFFVLVDTNALFSSSKMTTKVLKKWGEPEKMAWLAKQTIQRSYKEEVLAKIESFREKFDVIQYGALSYDPAKYPVYAVKTRNWSPSKRTVLVTGGVHGKQSIVHGTICKIIRY